MGPIYAEIFRVGLAGFFERQPVQIICKDQTETSFEPRCEKTGLRGFRPGPTQTGLYSHRWLEA